MKLKTIVFALLLIFLAACSQNASQQTTPTSAATVTISNFQFVPSTVTIKAGETVTWIQQDSVPHTVTIRGFDPSPALSKGQSWSKTFDKSGQYSYMCNIHPSMKGTVIVA